MRKLVVTDKGIGVAEMPEKPKEADYKIVAGPNARIGQTHEEYHVVLKLYNSAAKQAIASAPLFEDQERVKEELFYMKTGGPQVDVPVGSTYPIPPDFPEYVKVVQQMRHDKWYDVDELDPVFGFPNYRITLRFVDKQEQRKEEIGGGSDITVRFQPELKFIESENRFAVFVNGDEWIKKDASLQAENERLNKVIETIGASKTTVEMAEKINALQSKLDRVIDECDMAIAMTKKVSPRIILDLLK